MTMAWIEHAYRDGDALAAELAARLAAIVDAGLSQRGRAVLALAGGRTPLPAYRALAANWRARADASQIVLLPTDERCVPHKHPGSNVGELRSIFEGTGVQIESLTTRNGDCGKAEHYAAAMLADHHESFDAVVLGMGTDAHTASLFPNARQLEAALDSAAPLAAMRIDPDPLPVEAPFPRISLTAARLLNARSLHLAVTGELKRDVLSRAYAERDAQARPIAALLHAPGATVHVHWSP